MTPAIASQYRALLQAHLMMLWAEISGFLINSILAPNFSLSADSVRMHVTSA